MNKHLYRVGVDLGGTNIAVGIVDESYKIVKKGSVPTLPERDHKEIVRDMAALCTKLIDEAGLTYDDVEYAGIAAPGSVNSSTGVIEYSNNIRFSYFPIAEVFTSFTGVKKVYVDNDANAAALGEHIVGAAKGTQHSVMVTLGTGVGGGIIIDGKIFPGFNHAGAEIGHTVIVGGNTGRLCNCGRRGCWEPYSSATGLIKITREYMAVTPPEKTIMWEMIDGDINKVSGRTAFAAMKKGDEAAKKVVDEYLYYLGVGITNMVNIFQPEVLSIGGGICGEGDYLLKPIAETVEREQYARNTKAKCTIKIATLGNDAGIVGAAALGRQG